MSKYIKKVFAEFFNFKVITFGYMFGFTYIVGTSLFNGEYALAAVAACLLFIGGIWHLSSMLGNIATQKIVITLSESSSQRLKKTEESEADTRESRTYN